MQALVTHILPLTLVRRARLLPESGRVLVRAGQKVNATDVLAEAYTKNKHLLIDVRKALGIGRKEKISPLVDRRIGDKVQKDDVIAEAGGIFRRIVRSTLEGVIVAMQGGQILIEVQSTPYQLRAGFTGEVIEIIPERGAIIESSGALVQGVWGNNKIDLGVLLVLANSPDDELTRDRLDVSMRGAIVLAGHCSQADALQVAAQLPLRGLILGSMSGDLIPVAQKLEFPIILLEGIGKIPIDPVSYKILTTNAKRDVSINAASWDSFGGDRPEVFIPLPAGATIPPETDRFEVGQTVRIQGQSRAGQVGILTNIRPGSTKLANGLRVPSADIRFENNEQITVPLANLDVLE